MPIPQQGLDSRAPSHSSNGVRPSNSQSENQQQQKLVTGTTKESCRNSSLDFTKDVGDVESRGSEDTDAVEDTSSKDDGFAFLFLANALIITCLAVARGEIVLDMLRSSGDETVVHITALMLQDIAKLIAACSIFAILMTSYAMMFISRYPTFSVRAILVANGILSLLVVVISFCRGKMWLGTVAVAGYLTSLLLMRWASSRMDFVIGNLKVAKKVLSAHVGLYTVGLFSLVILSLWTLIWSVATLGTLAGMAGCSNGVCKNGSSSVSIIVSIYFLYSYNWTYQVIKNVTTVTISQTTGSWWLHVDGKQEDSMVRKAFIKSMSTRFGSICVGSLTMSLVLAINGVLDIVERQGGSMCLAGFLIDWSHAVTKYFHTWAYVYIGLYDIGFVEAGRRVVVLFHAAGWTSFLTNNLVNNLIFLASAGIGLMTSVIGAGFALSFNLMPNMSEKSAALVALIVGFTVGLVICQVLMNVLSAVVITSVVCYAEHPDQLERNHPEASEKLRSAWGIVLSTTPTDDSHCYQAFA